MKFFKNLLMVLVSMFLLFVINQSEVNAQPKVFLSTNNDDVHITIGSGKIWIKSCICNNSPVGVYITEIKISGLTISGKGKSCSYPDKVFYFGDLYIGAGEKVWHTFAFDDDSMQDVTAGGYHFKSNVWYKRI